ncbi:MAG TPA: hypothetical protein DIW31_02460 [Bacteroidales bacterium]|nr:hypothetical protein [Bacteroidales bacterium]
MLLYNLKLVFRNLLKNKLYSFLSITGFAFGFAVCIVIALYAYNEYTVDHCYPNYSRVFRLVNEKEKTCIIDYKLNQIISDDNPEIEISCPVGTDIDFEFNIKSENQCIKTKGVLATNNNFFRLFSLHVLKSLSNKPFSDKKTAAITESLAKKLFKDGEDPLGKSISILNYIDATVSAVVEDFPVNSSIKATVLLNAENDEYLLSMYCDNGICFNPVDHYFLLNQTANSVEFASKLNKNIDKYKFAIDSIGLQPLKNIYLDTSIKDNKNLAGSKNLILILIGIGVLIMLLSTINYMNYNLSLQYAKLREIGIKRINGAKFHNLAGYFFIDVSVGIIVSIDFALVFVAILIPEINNLLGKHLSLDVLLTPQMILLSVFIVILIIIINTIVPLYILSRFNVSTFFTGKKQQKGQMVGRSILTILQFSIAIALLSCIFIIKKQLSYAQNADLGFNKEHLLNLILPGKCEQQQLLKQEINKLPFVMSSSLSRGVPGNITLGMGNGDSTIKSFSLACLYVDHDFLKTMDIELIAGRWFLNGDLGKACVMNQEAIKQYEWKDFRGKRYNNGQEGGFEVVGVIKDFHVTSFHEKIEPTCIMSCPPKWLERELQNLNVRITPGDVSGKMKQIEKIWKKVIPDDPMDFTFYDTMFDAMYRKEKLLAKIIMIFSLISVLLSCMGVLGQISQSCINRTKEIGIRKVTGASTWTIIRMLNFDFVKLIFIAFAIATPLAYYIMDKWLQNFAYKTIMSWWVFALAGVVIFTISVITVTWHSWRIASKNPVEALRYE